MDDIMGFKGVFLSIYAKFGFLGVFGILILALIIFVIYEIIRYTIVKHLQEDKQLFLDKVHNFIFKKTINDINLLNHPTFHRFNLFLQTGSLNLMIQCNLRKKLIIDMFLYRVENTNKILKDFFKNTKVEDIPNNQIKCTIEALLTQIDINWEQTLEQKKFPVCAVNKFKELILPIRNSFYYMVAEIFSGENPVFENNTQKFSMLLDIIGSSEYSTILFASRAIMDLNGQISQLEYNGVKCNNCGYCKFKFYPSNKP